MQQTRQYILEILRELGEATVDELVKELKTRIHHEITAVTIRHHLDILRSEDLVTAPAVRRRSAPGRPQYVYSLTEKARDHFPNNYVQLVNSLIGQIKSSLPPAQVNVLLEGVADQMVANAQLGTMAGLTIETRLNHVVDYLNRHGYDADWETDKEGFVLHTRNCPYHQVVGEHDDLCGMDMRLISGLLGVVPRSLGRLSHDDESCSYLIPWRK
jgi:predicted ArsR family transcriptional regulator